MEILKVGDLDLRLDNIKKSRPGLANSLKHVLEVTRDLHNVPTKTYLEVRVPEGEEASVRNLSPVERAKSFVLSALNSFRVAYDILEEEGEVPEKIKDNFLVRDLNSLRNRVIHEGFFEVNLEGQRTARLRRESLSDWVVSYKEGKIPYEYSIGDALILGIRKFVNILEKEQ